MPIIRKTVQVEPVETVDAFAGTFPPKQTLLSRVDEHVDSHPECNVEVALTSLKRDLSLNERNKPALIRILAETKKIKATVSAAFGAWVSVAHLEHKKRLSMQKEELQPVLQLIVDVEEAIAKNALPPVLAEMLPAPPSPQIIVSDIELFLPWVIKTKNYHLIRVETEQLVKFAKESGWPDMTITIPGVAVGN